MKSPIQNDSLRISGATSEDLKPIAQHYAIEVNEGVATFDTTIPPPSYWEHKLEMAQLGDYPFLVARCAKPAHELSGWVSLSPYDSKAAYSRCAELSIYVLTTFQGKGIGRALMESILHEVEMHPSIHTLISRIVPTQTASIRLHESLGFELVGTMIGVGEKLGRLRDVAIYQFTSR